MASQHCELTTYHQLMYTFMGLILCYMNFTSFFYVKKNVFLLLGHSPKNWKACEMEAHVWSGVTILLAQRREDVSMCWPRRRRKCLSSSAFMLNLLLYAQGGRTGFWERGCSSCGNFSRMERNHGFFHLESNMDRAGVAWLGERSMGLKLIQIQIPKQAHTYSTAWGKYCIPLFCTCPLCSLLCVRIKWDTACKSL